MGLEVLVPLVMGALLKVAGKVADGALGAVEDAAKRGAAEVFAKIKSWWSTDLSASGDLARFEAEPDMYLPVVEARMVKKLIAEPEMQASLAALVERPGPHVEVFQTIAKAHGITGVKVKEMIGGRVHVDQKVNEGASDITGADIDRLG
ncbi:hypothetical protein ACIA5G_52465 [Amycolatopsis sp. NPDC051758]|uniref:hypothetical protein n=1 Tax=Amycolatopsis sp. NPDC051758 TaxID=3363935 RepID=UPI00379B3F36